MLVPRGDNSYRMLVEELRAGRIAVMACDTIYGFVGVAPQTDAAIRQIKGRGETKPFLRLISHRDEAERSGAILPESEIFTLWPGPFTFVLPMRDGSSVAFRVPQDERLRDLVADVGAPLFSTSVNRAGNPPMDDPEVIDGEFGREVALVEDSGLFSGRKPSTVVDLTIRPFRVLRQGAGEVPSVYLS